MVENIVNYCMEFITFFSSSDWEVEHDSPPKILNAELNASLKFLILVRKCAAKSSIFTFFRTTWFEDRFQVVQQSMYLSQDGYALRMS